MIIQTVDLPSHGFNSSMSTIVINPMTFEQMINYSRDRSTDSYISKLLADIKLLRLDNPNIGELNYYDLESVMLLKKVASVGDSPVIRLPDIECPDCGRKQTIEVDISKLKYVGIDETEVTKITAVRLGNKTFGVKLPKISDVEMTIKRLSVFANKLDQKIFNLINIIDFTDKPNEVVNAIKSATKDEILLLDYLEKVFSGKLKSHEYTCINEKCMRKESVMLSESITDMFQFLRCNSQIDESKIISIKGV